VLAQHPTGGRGDVVQRRDAGGGRTEGLDRRPDDRDQRAVQRPGLIEPTGLAHPPRQRAMVAGATSRLNAQSFAPPRLRGVRSR